MERGQLRVQRWHVGKSTAGEQRMSEVPWRAFFLFSEECNLAPLEATKEELAAIIRGMEARGEAVPPEYLEALAELKTEVKISS